VAALGEVAAFGEVEAPMPRSPDTRGRLLDARLAAARTVRAAGGCDELEVTLEAAEGQEAVDVELPVSK
jgi:hypothetical protein